MSREAWALVTSSQGVGKWEALVLMRLCEDQMATKELNPSLPGQEFHPFSHPEIKYLGKAFKSSVTHIRPYRWTLSQGPTEEYWFYIGKS